MHQHNLLEDIKRTGVIKITWKDRTCSVAAVKLINTELIIYYTYCDDNPDLIEKDKNGYQLSVFNINDNQLSTIASVKFVKNSVKNKIV